MGSTLGIGTGFYYFTQPTTSLKVSDPQPKGRFGINALEFTPFEIKAILEINHDTKLYRLEVPQNEALWLPVTSCIVTRIPSNLGEKQILRPYTPISDEDAVGYLDLLIKHYPNGVMTNHLLSLKPGDRLEVRGPVLKYLYRPNTLDQVVLIAGGTGITPMFQLLKKILNNPKDRTKVALIFANRTERDILLKEELDHYAKVFPDRFKVAYTLDTPPPNWTGGQGFITKAMLQKYLPPKDMEDLMIFVCGPTPMVDWLSGKGSSRRTRGEVGGLLGELGYTRANVYNF